MQKNLLSYVIIFGMPLLACVGAEKPVGTPDESDREVLAVESARVAALEQDDFPALEEILSDDLLYTHSSGVAETKAEFMAALRSGRLKYRSLQHENVIANVIIGAGTAFLAGRTHVTSVLEGKELSLYLHFTIIYIKQGGRWRMMAWRSVRLPADGGIPLGAVDNSGSTFALWDPATPYPELSSIRPVPGVEYSLVHRQTPDHLFLHEPRLEFHEAELFVNFSNAPRIESEPLQIIRGRRSPDGGRTWTPVEVVVGPLSGDERYETTPLLSQAGRLRAFVGRYAVSSRNSLGMEVFDWRTHEGKFRPVLTSFVPRFVPFVRPQPLANGNWIIGGHTDKVTMAAVAISVGDDLTRWRVVNVPIPTPRALPCPETALLVNGSEVLAIVRNQDEMRPLVSVSRDSGETFSPAVVSNLPMVGSKPFAGTLSSGQRYLIYNGAAPGSRSRNNLLIAVTSPGQSYPFKKVWQVIGGVPDDVRTALGMDEALVGDQAWAYPEAVERDGVLYVVFSQNKKHCWLARIPVSTLRLE